MTCPGRIEFLTYVKCLWSSYHRLDGLGRDICFLYFVSLGNAKILRDLNRVEKIKGCYARVRLDPSHVVRDDPYVIARDPYILVRDLSFLALTLL